MSNPLNQSEKTVEKECVKYAKSLGWMFRKQQGQGNRGKTDRFFMKNGITVFVEFKRPGATPTTKQLNEIVMLKENGFIAKWFDSIGEFKHWMWMNDENMSIIAAQILYKNAIDRGEAFNDLDDLYSWSN